MEQAHLELSNFKLEMSKSARETMMSTTKLQTGTGYFSPGVFFSPHDNLHSRCHCLHFAEKESEAQKVVVCIKATYSERGRI